MQRQLGLNVPVPCTADSATVTLAVAGCYSDDSVMMSQAASGGGDKGVAAGRAHGGPAERYAALAPGDAARLPAARAERGLPHVSGRGQLRGLVAEEGRSEVRLCCTYLRRLQMSVAACEVYSVYERQLHIVASHISITRGHLL